MSGEAIGALSFRNIDLHGANLTGVDLRKANLYEANLSAVNLSETDLRGVDLRRVEQTRPISGSSRAFMIKPPRLCSGGSRSCAEGYKNLVL